MSMLSVLPLSVKVPAFMPPTSVWLYRISPSQQTFLSRSVAMGENSKRELSVCVISCWSGELFVKAFREAMKFCLNLEGNFENIAFRVAKSVIKPSAFLLLLLL